MVWHENYETQGNCFYETRLNLTYDAQIYDVGLRTAVVLFTTI